MLLALVEITSSSDDSDDDFRGEVIDDLEISGDGTGDTTGLAEDGRILTRAERRKLRKERKIAERQRQRQMEERLDAEGIVTRGRRREVETSVRAHFSGRSANAAGDDRRGGTAPN